MAWTIGRCRWCCPTTAPPTTSPSVLRGEGLDVARRWRFLVVSMPSEEDAEKLAERIRAEAPPEAKVSVALAYGRVIADMPYSGFSSFGGLGV